jgi:outer membrane immunogenic protein
LIHVSQAAFARPDFAFSSGPAACFRRRHAERAGSGHSRAGPHRLVRAGLERFLSRRPCRVSVRRYPPRLPAAGTAGTTGPGFGFNTDGFAGGGQVGYNWQIDRFVVGGEADISWANLDGSRTIPGGTVSVQSDWLSTVRGRAGVTFDRVFIYGTGGIAFTSLETSVTGAGVPAASDKNTLTGWTAGAGIEVALTENLSVKGEYLWVDFSDEPFALGGPRAVPGDLDGSYARVGLNYKLNLF